MLTVIVDSPMDKSTYQSKTTVDTSLYPPAQRDDLQTQVVEITDEELTTEAQMEADATDLYPAIARSIENVGSQSQKRALHQIQQKVSSKCLQCGHVLGGSSAHTRQCSTSSTSSTSSIPSTPTSPTTPTIIGEIAGASDLYPNAFRGSINRPDQHLRHRRQRSKEMDDIDAMDRIEQTCADVYPSVARRIENLGTDAEREALHRLEGRRGSTCSDCGFVLGP